VNLLFGKLGITTRLESPFKFDVVWQIRIWYSISTDIIGYANQVLVTDQDVGVRYYMPNNKGNGETGEGGWYYINIVLTSNS